MTTKQFRDLVGNKFFTAKFKKKDGTIRVMNARLGVKKHLKGGKLGYDPKKLNYVTVFDMTKNAYRTLNLNTLVEVKTNGYKVVCNEVA